MLRLVLLKLTYDRQKKQGLPTLEEGRQVGGNDSLQVCRMLFEK